MLKRSKGGITDTISIAMGDRKIKPGTSRSMLNKRLALLSKHESLSSKYSKIAKSQEYTTEGYEAAKKAEYHDEVAGYIRYSRKIPDDAKLQELKKLANAKVYNRYRP